MEESSRPALRESVHHVYDFRNARIKQDDNQLVKKSITSTLNEDNSQDQRNILKTFKAPEMRVKANQFADQVRALDSVASTAKMKLMEIRNKKSDSRNIIFAEFNSFMENKPFSIVFINKLIQKVYIFNPEKLSAGLAEIKVPESNHNIIDKPSSLPPVSKKVADLQQVLGIPVNGLFDAETFHALTEFYCNLLLKGDVKPTLMFEKLIISLVQRIGSDVKAGAFLKGLLVVKAALASVQAGKTGELDKLNLLMDKYLPDNYRFKLKERVRVAQKLSQAINKPDFEKSETILKFIKEEKDNLVTEDKIKILDTFVNLSSTIFSNDTDKSKQIELIKSVVNVNLTDEQKKK